MVLHRVWNSCPAGRVRGSLMADSHSRERRRVANSTPSSIQGAHSGVRSASHAFAVGWRRSRRAGSTSTWRKDAERGGGGTPLARGARQSARRRDDAARGAPKLAVETSPSSSRCCRRTRRASRGSAGAAGGGDGGVARTRRPRRRWRPAAPPAGRASVARGRGRRRGGNFPDVEAEANSYFQRLHSGSEPWSRRWRC